CESRCWSDVTRYACFFFQAEDGIRDLIVTGVQTCALPISPGKIVPAGWLVMGVPARQVRQMSPEELEDIRNNATTYVELWRRHRSEERRVGKECRSRWALEHQKKHEYEPFAERFLHSD